MSTIRLYREDVYRTEASGLILTKEAGKKGTVITMDQSIFFPEGGGQPILSFHSVLP